MKTLGSSLAITAITCLALTACGSDDKKASPPPLTTTPTASSLTPTSTVTATPTTTPTTTTTNKNTATTTPTTVTPVTSDSTLSKGTESKVPATTSSKAPVTSTATSTMAGKEFFKNTKGVIWASSGNLTKTGEKSKAKYSYKNLDAGFYTIDVNCSGGDAKIMIEGGGQYAIKCNGVSDGGNINACLKSKSDVVTVLTSNNSNIKYIWQLRKVKETC